MASERLVELLRLGPFTAVDTTTAGPYNRSGHSGTGANPHRITGALCAELGRTNLANVTVGGTGSTLATIAPYAVSASNEQIVGATLSAGVYSRFMYDPALASQALLQYGSATDSAFFDQAVQYGNVLYDNAGHQYSSANPSNTYSWQQPAPAAGQAYAVAAAPGTMNPGTYIYAFSQVVTAPNGAFVHETSSLGQDASPSGLYPYQITLSTNPAVPRIYNDVSGPVNSNTLETTARVSWPTVIGHTIVFVVSWDANPVGGGTNVVISSVSAGTLGTPQLIGSVQQGNINLAFYWIQSALSAGDAITVTFSGSTFSNMPIFDFTGVNNVALTTAAFASYGTNSVSGTSFAANDLTYGFFAARDSGASTLAFIPASSEIYALGIGTAGYYAGMGVESGPIATEASQNITVSATWGGTPTDTSNVAALLVVSGAAAAGTPRLTGTFAGTNVDGSTYTTNVYRQSSNQPVWFFLTNLATNSAYLDTASDLSITSNAQLDPYRDPPPNTPSNLAAIALHKERMWSFTVQNDAQTGNVPQTQLWYSNYGRPWEFDGTNNVMLVGNSATPSGLSGYAGTYGDVPVALISLSSVLLCFKSRTVWVVYGDDASSFVARQFLNVGCRARHSVALAPLPQAVVAFFLTERGVCMTDGYSYQYVSEPIRSVIESLSLADRTNAVGFYSDYAYYISFPQLGQTWAYYTATQDWFGPLPYATSLAFAVPANPSVSGGSGQVNEVTAVRLGGTEIDQWFSGGDLDLGAPQQVSWSGPLTDSGQPGVEKEFASITINAPLQPGISAQVTLSIDPGTTVSPGGGPKQYTWTFDLGAGTTQTVTVPTDYRGFLAQLSVSFTTSTTVPGPAHLYSVVAAGVYGRPYVPHG